MRQIVRGLGIFAINKGAMLYKIPGQQITEEITYTLPPIIEDHLWAAGWTVVPSGTNTSGGLTYSQETDGPNSPGYARKINHDFLSVGGACAYFWIYEQQQINLASIGGVRSIRFTDWTRMITADAMAARWLVRQGGRYYLAIQDNLMNTTPWIQRTGVFTASQADWLGEYLIGSGSIVVGRPDLSSTGAPLYYGYWRANSSIPGYIVQSEIADWVVVTTRIPP